jgi:hypothetical protein
MGASQSSPNFTNVFAKELGQLNAIVSKVISHDGKFSNPNYNFLFEDACKNYTVVWEKELSKHLKVDLGNLSGSIYLLPKKDLVVSHEDKVEVSKQELCDKITKHYIKILYVISLIKHVFDLEQDGDHSLAGIMKRNIKVVDGIMEIHYCSIPHKDYDHQEPGKINFESLSGFHFFVENFLDPVEKYAFLEQFKALLARKPPHKLNNAICLDTLVPARTYEETYSTKLSKPVACPASSQIPSVKRKRRHLDLMFEVASYNPIFNTNYCMSQKKKVISLNRSDPAIRKLMDVHGKMHTHYVDNVDAVLAILEKLVIEKDHETYELRNISSDVLQSIIKEVKQKVVVFYLQSLVDFHLLLDLAKEIPSLQLDKSQ